MIKVTTGEEKKEEPKSKYPYLGQSKDSKLIVRFNAPSCGCVIVGDSSYDDTRYSTTWIEKNFTPLTEPITLQNVSMLVKAWLFGKQVYPHPTMPAHARFDGKRVDRFDINDIVLESREDCEELIKFLQIQKHCFLQDYSKPQNV